MFEREIQCAPTAHRESLNRARGRRADDAVGLLDVWDQVFDDRVLVLRSVLRIQVETVLAGGRNDDQLTDLALFAHLVDSGCDLAVLEIALGAVHSVQEVQNGIAPLRVSLVRRRKLNRELQLFAKRRRLKRAVLDSAAR